MAGLGPSSVALLRSHYQLVGIFIELHYHCKGARSHVPCLELLEVFPRHGPEALQSSFHSLMMTLKVELTIPTIQSLQDKVIKAHGVWG